MTDEDKGPEGWEAEEYEREKIRELREQGLDPASLQRKLKDIGHPSAHNAGVDSRAGDVQAPTGGDGPGQPQIPGGDERDLVDRPSGGANRPQGETEASED